VRLSRFHWQRLLVQTACEAMHDDHCLGRYGFAVRSDGSYLAGPSPAGRRVEGRITPDELARLDHLADAFSAAGAAQELDSGPTLPGIKDQLDVEFDGGAAIRVYELGGPGRKIRYRGAWADATRLHAELRKLLERYYPTPFPPP
jgi:hypothetical protein